MNKKLIKELLLKRPPHLKLSTQEVISSLETYAKAGASVLALFYVVGLLIFSLYYSGLHIRSIELLRTRYIFVGFYFISFLFLHLLVPNLFIRRLWLRVMYLGVTIIAIVLMNDVFNRYFQFRLEMWTDGTSYLVFTPAQGGIVIGKFIVLMMTAIMAPILVAFAIFLLRIARKANLKGLAIILLVLALWFDCSLFIRSVFPNISDSMGGGETPVVRIEFNNNVPENIKGYFDISVPGYQGSKYWGRLVYMDSGSVFLQEAPWFSTTVHELKREHISMLDYTNFNPVEIGSPPLNR